MKILHIVPRLERGGVERCVIDEAVYMTRKKKMNVIVMSGGGSLLKELTNAKVPHIQRSVYTKNPLKIIWNAMRLYRFCKRENIEMIHVHSRAPAWMVFIATRFLKVKWGTTYHGLYGAKLRIKRFYNRVMLKGDFVIAPSQSVAKHIKNIYGFKNVKVISRWIDLDKFNVKKITEKQREIQRKKWGVKKDEILFFLPGRISRIKGQLLFLKAFSQLKNKKIKAIIFGGGSENYKKEIQTLASKKQVIFDEGQLLPIHYASVDCTFATTLKPETFGLTILEAKAMGSPIIGAKQGGFLDLIEAEKTGWFFTPRSEKSLQKAMEIFLKTSQSKRQKMGRNTVENAQKYELSKMMDLILKFYNR
ncbi:MAG: glycosyltransferase [Alphaproteobacteria bacterium]